MRNSKDTPKFIYIKKNRFYYKVRKNIISLRNYNNIDFYFIILS